MIKKIFAAACIMCLALMAVGCSNKTSNETKIETESGNTVTEATKPPIEFDLYSLSIVATIGDTGIKPHGEENFTPNLETATIAQVGHGTTGEYIGREDAYDSNGLVFYIFESEEDANTAFEYIKTNIVQSSATITENSIKGLDRNAVDILITHYYYINRNMIIYHLDYMSDPGVIEVESEESAAANKILHEEIESIWNY